MNDSRPSAPGPEPLVFVIDDDDSVRRSVSRLLRSFQFAVETFASAEEFLKRDRYDGVGCIVLDVRMPGLDGMALQNILIDAGRSMPIIFVTGHGDIPMGVKAMKKGAADFLPKPFDDEEFIEAVRRAIEKDKKAKADYAEVHDILTGIELLTPREHEILRHVMSGMLNKQIAYKLNIAEKTVKVHRSHIMEKLNAGSVAELTRLAMKAGIEPL